MRADAHKAAGRRGAEKLLLLFFLVYRVFGRVFRARGFALWVYGIWDMGYGIWDMGYGIWDMGYGIWDMDIGSPWRMRRDETRRDETEAGGGPSVFNRLFITAMLIQYLATH